MQFGVALPNYRRLASTENLVQVARRSEALGFDSVWVTDHVVVPEAHREIFGSTVYDPLTVLAFLAAVTERVKLGTSVLVIPYRDPRSVAKQLATIDTLSGGRVVLGTGAGWAREEFEALGVPFDERGAMTDEYLRVIIELWTSARPHFEGKYVTFDNVHAGPRPVQQPHPPILIGGYGKRAIRRAIEMGQGWFPDGMSLVTLDQWIQYMRQSAIKHGRDPVTLSVTLRTPLWLSNVANTANAASKAAGKVELPWEQSTAGAAETERPPFQGSVQQVIDDIAEAERIGVDHLMFESPIQRGDERFDMIEAFAQDVLPAFRSATVQVKVGG